jgi:hypothetical protein
MVGEAGADAVDVALRVGTAIEGAGGAYFVGGSLASSFQGEPRATNDVDIVLDLALGRIDGLVASLGPDFEVDTDMLRDALVHARSCNVFYLPVVMKVDLFGVGSTPFDESEFARRRRVAVRGPETLVIKSAEDTVLRKLLWYREGGYVSDRQWRDVVEVLRVSGGGMDRPYLTEWATRLRVAEMLERASTEAGEP